jgi:3D (Asp-Asp-Asp) domain-containing protein
MKLKLRLWISILVFAAFLCVRPFEAQIGGEIRRLPFLATMYATTGTTKSGLETQPGTVAADTSVLPLGTKIRVTNAGPYSGIYTVTDTGSKVRGHHIDIFMPSWHRAKEFGRKVVQVTVLKWGDWGNGKKS